MEVKSAGFRRNPRKHAAARNKKGQPRVVDLNILVEAGGIECESASIGWSGYDQLLKLFRAELLPDSVLHGAAQYCTMQRA